MKKKHQNTYGASGKTEEPWLEKYFIKSSVFKASLIVLVFFSLGFFIYSNTFQSPFVFDDKMRIVENPAIRIDKLTFQNLWNAAFSKLSARSRPIGNISFALNYYFHQHVLAGYHIVNIIIHIISGILLWLFLKKTLNLKSVRPEFINGEWIALFAAFLWLANPVQTQSVTYIVQRLNSMAAMFFLLSFLCYLNGRLAPKKRRRWTWLLGAALGWLLALGCKQNTATLPFFIFLYEWYFFQDLSVDWLKRNLKYFLIIFIIFFIVSLIFLGSKPLDRITSITDYANKEFTLSERVMTQFRVVIYYLSLIFYPNPSRLNLDYNFPLSYSLFNPFTTLLSLIIIIGLIILGLYLARKQRLISFCIFWFLGNLVIESSVIPLAIIFEHRLYLPSMLVGLVSVILFYRYIKPAWLPVSIACAIIALFSYWTFERNKVWQDEITLWTDCVKKSPNKARPYSILGQVLTERRRYDEALPNYLKALQINPNYVDARYNLGFLYDEQGKTDEAIEQYRKAVQVKPNYVKAHNNLGLALLKQGKTEEAIEHYRKALKAKPNFDRAHSNLGLALAKQGKLDEAIEHYRQALQINPDLAEAQLNLGNALAKQGKTEQGLSHLKKALRIKPDYAEAHNNLGGELLRQGKTDEALKHFTAALNTNPDMAEAHNNIGIILANQGKIDAAILHFQDALRIDPGFKLAEHNLKKALAMRQNKMDTEINRIQAALQNDPDDPVLLYESGNLFLSRKDLTGAINQYEKALSIQPNFPEALNNLALAYTIGRQFDQALVAFQKLIVLQPDNATNYYNLAVLYALQNNVSESLAWLNKAITKGYDNWDLIKTDKDLENIRNSKGYRELIKGQ